MLLTRSCAPALGRLLQDGLWLFDLDSHLSPDKLGQQEVLSYWGDLLHLKVSEQCCISVPGSRTKSHGSEVDMMQESRYLLQLPHACFLCCARSLLAMTSSGSCYGRSCSKASLPALGDSGQGFSTFHAWFFVFGAA